MSQQPGGFLQMAASYNFDRNKLNNYRHKTISSEGFQKWTQPNMYKSSYAHYHSKDSVEPKNTAVPGYGGYIPYIKAQNVHAKGYSVMAKQSFNQEKLGRNPHGLATTGFNLDRNAVIDHSKIASSSKYGKSQIQKAHPGWNAFWKSTTHQTFKVPQNQLDPTYRPTQKHVQTHKLPTKSSGFATNHAFQDGQGWKPDPVLKGDNNRSQYRDRLNADHPFHRNTHLAKLAQLPRKEYNYKFN